MPPKKRKKAVSKRRSRTPKSEEFVDTRDLDKFFIKKSFFISIGAQIVNLFLILSLCFFNIKIREAREIAAESRMVAWQLKSSTEYLQDNARAYACLQEEEYKIRFTAERERQSGYTENIKNNFKKEEIEHINKALGASQLLFALETNAFNVSKSNPEAGVKMLFQLNYRQQKEKVYSHIDDFIGSVEKRCGGKVDRLIKYNWLIIVMMFFISSWSFNAIVRSRKNFPKIIK
tara:strand:- start:702 stop:1397 length:696 start_codon:yes stop_codon:yes gene_type:complete